MFIRLASLTYNGMGQRFWRRRDARTSGERNEKEEAAKIFDPARIKPPATQAKLQPKALHKSRALGKLRTPEKLSVIRLILDEK